MDDAAATTPDAAAVVAAWLQLAGVSVSAERAAELAIQARRLELTIWTIKMPERTEPWR